MPEFGYPKGLLDTLSLAGTSPSETSPAGKFSTGGVSAGIDRAESDITPMTPMTLLGTLAAGQSRGPAEESAAKKADIQETHPPVSKRTLCETCQVPGTGQNNITLYYTTAHATIGSNLVLSGSSFDELSRLLCLG